MTPLWTCRNPIQVIFIHITLVGGEALFPLTLLSCTLPMAYGNNGVGTAIHEGMTVGFVQHLVSLMGTLQAYGSWTCSGSYNSSRAVMYHFPALHDVTMTLRCALVWICAILSCTNIVLWMKYVLRVGRALAIFSQEEEREWNLTRPTGMRFLSILFNLVKHSRCCTTQMANGIDSCNGTRFRIRWKIILFNSASPRWIEHQSRTIAQSAIHHLYIVVHLSTVIHLSIMDKIFVKYVLCFVWICL